MIISGMEHFQDVCKKKLVNWYNNSELVHKGLNKVKKLICQMSLWYGVVRRYRIISV